MNFIHFSGLILLAALSTMSRADPLPPARITLHVKGMMCGDCSDRVTAALQKIPGVKSVSMHRKVNQVVVVSDSAEVSEDLLIHAVEAEGFFAKPIHEPTQEMKTP